MSRALPWRQTALITLGAAGVLAVFYLLPAGSNLTPMDFLADKAAVLQFCDPLNARPLPVIAGRPPVTLAVTDASQPDAASRRVSFTLTTISGKPIGPADLLPRGHPEVGVAITDSTGTEFHPASAAPGQKPGEWTVAFAPARAGACHLAVTFTPAATGTEIGAAGDFRISGALPSGPD